MSKYQSIWEIQLKQRIPFVKYVHKYFVKLSTNLGDVKINEEIKNKKYKKRMCYYLSSSHPSLLDLHSLDFIHTERSLLSDSTRLLI